MPRFLDCTLRDGGYYNDWNFSEDLIEEYLDAMPSAGVDTVELGFRSVNNDRFKGACAFTTDNFINSLKIPDGIVIGVMINASELIGGGKKLEETLEILFPRKAGESPVGLVRVACHMHEFVAALPAVSWLKNRGFEVGFNLMQVADRSPEELETISSEAAKWPLDVLYFADSMGGMDLEKTKEVIDRLGSNWEGDLGIHAHDNMGMALQNTIFAIDNGVSWVDSTVAGMGRGPGNAKTEYLAIRTSDIREECNIIPLLGLISRRFEPMLKKYRWGTNAYYFLSGKYGIHPTFVQVMINDARYSEEDILAVIEYLKVEGGKKFSPEILDSAREFYKGELSGKWAPEEMISGREILILGTGPGVALHRRAIEKFIRKTNPFVIALNTQKQIDAELINARIACHPLRLLADCSEHSDFPQPLITPASMLPESVLSSLGDKVLLDFGIGLQSKEFAFEKTYCELPNSMVMSYALAVSTSGKGDRILLSGFDGYEGNDPRNAENNQIFQKYLSHDDSLECLSITPTRYELDSISVYGLL